VVPIDPRTPIPAVYTRAEAVVDLLTDLLKRAKAGEITGISIGTVEPTGAVAGFRASGECSLQSLVLAARLASLQVERVWGYALEEE
jgi:hypothetical protein